MISLGVLSPGVSISILSMLTSRWTSYLQHTAINIACDVFALLPRFDRALIGTIHCHFTYGHSSLPRFTNTISSDQSEEAFACVIPYNDI